MPFTQIKKRTTPFHHFNSDLQTIIPNVFRKFPPSPFTRKSLKTPDNDILETDWVEKNNDKIAILTHGLTGSSRGAYMSGMTQILMKNGFDVLSWSQRSCGDKMNLQLKTTNMGATYDLRFLVDYVANLEYQEIYLFGVSLGGNITLKYLGEEGKNFNKKLKKAATFSVPSRVMNSSLAIRKWRNFIYHRRFVKQLIEVAKKKAEQFPEINIKAIKKVKTIYDFDHYFTAPLHGYKSVEEYYDKTSAIYFIPKIKIPTLLVNSKNDTYLGNIDELVDLSEKSSFFYYKLTQDGGHVGFGKTDKNGFLWSEKEALKFFNQQM